MGRGSVSDVLEHLSAVFESEVPFESWHASL